MFLGIGVVFGACAQGLPYGRWRQTTAPAGSGLMQVNAVRRLEDYLLSALVADASKAGGSNVFSSWDYLEGCGSKKQVNMGETQLQPVIFQ